MFNYYQPFLLPFLRIKKGKLPRGIKQLYYHSAEDALWHLFEQKGLTKGSVILLPSFYCIDVVDNIKNHGYSPVFYEVDVHFQVDEEVFLQTVFKSNPAAIIFFHSSGITFRACNKKLVGRIVEKYPDCMIIEDCVHRLINPSRVRLFAPTHFLIDSLRKVSPLPGSFVYGDRKYLASVSPRHFKWSAYRWLSLWWFFCFRLTFMVATFINSSRLIAFAHEVVLKKHDDLIGDSFEPPPGFGIYAWLHRFVDFDRVEQCKRVQVEMYQKLFEQITANFLELHLISVPKADSGLLHVYPVRIHMGAQTEQVKKLIWLLHQKGIVIWAKFPDCPWSQDQTVLYFPLGFHITLSSIERACAIFQTCLLEAGFVTTHSRHNKET